MALSFSLSGLGALLAAALLAAGCSVGGETPPPAQGTLSVALTSSAGCEAGHLRVTVTGVRVNANSQAADDDPGWQTIPLAAPRTVDLATLAGGGLDELGSASIPTGEYQRLQLQLANGTVLPANDMPQRQPQPLRIDGAAHGDLTLTQPFSVLSRQRTYVAVDVAQCSSLVPQAGGVAWQPVATLTSVAQSGRISGDLAPGLADAVVLAQRNGAELKRTRADAQGHFSLYPLPQSASTGTYDIVISKAGYTTGIVRAVPVRAGQDTVIALATAPLSLPAAPATRTLRGTVTPPDKTAHLALLQLTEGAAFQIGTAYTGAGGAYQLALPATPPRIGIYGGRATIAWLPADDASTTAPRYMLSANIPGTPTRKTVPDVTLAGNETTVAVKF